MLYSAKRGLAIACRPSVRPSVCDVGGSGSHRLEFLETNCTDKGHPPTPSACPMWAYPGTAQIFGLPPPPIISGTDRATNFKFCTLIHRIDRNKSPFKTSGKVAVGVVNRDSRKFSGTHSLYRAHRAVIFAIAQLSRLLTVLNQSTHQSISEFISDNKDTVKGGCVM